MTKTIAELAVEEFELRERLRYLGACNTSGLDYEERKKQATEYAEARAAAFSAWKALEDAIQSGASKQEAR